MMLLREKKIVAFQIGTFKVYEGRLQDTRGTWYVGFRKTSGTYAGFFLTRSKAVAVTYSGADVDRGEGVKVGTLKGLKKVCEIPCNHKSFSSIFPYPYTGFKYATDYLANEAFKRGYDGIIFKDIVDPGPVATFFSQVVDYTTKILKKPNFSSTEISVNGEKFTSLSPLIDVKTFVKDYLK